MLGSSRKIKSSGKRHNDALVELSFVLSLPANEASLKLAENYVKQHRFGKIVKISMFALNESHTQFNVWAESSQIVKVPQEQKKPTKKNEVSEYDQVIARATAHVKKHGQKKVVSEEEVAVHIALAPEMAEQKTAQTQQKPRRRFRPRRRRGRRSPHKAQGEMKQESTSSAEVKETVQVLAKPVEPQES